MKRIIWVFSCLLFAKSIYANDLCSDVERVASNFNVELASVLSKPDVTSSITLRAGRTKNSKVDRFLTLKNLDLDNDGVVENFVEYIRPLRGRRYSKYLYVLDSSLVDGEDLRGYLEERGLSSKMGLDIKDILEYPVKLAHHGIRETDLNWEEIWMELVTIKSKNYALIRTAYKSWWMFSLIRFDRDLASGAAVVCKVKKKRF